jgi:hypothetical protein
MIQSDIVYLALGATETTETSLGTITVPNTGVSRIVGIYAKDTGVATIDEHVDAYIRLQFKTVPGVFKFPAQTSEDLHTAVGPTGTSEPKYIPVDIPVPPNEAVQIYMAQFALSTGARFGICGLLFQ